MSLLTACITTFNRPELLQESIESLVNQTYKDFDILILNNGNDEETKNMIKFYMKKNTRLIAINHEPISISKQRNLALKKVKTKYIGFLDDDDLWAPNKVEEFYKQFSFFQNNLAFFYSGFCFFKQINKSRRLFYKKIYDPKSNLKELLIQRGDFTGSASNPIINVRNAIDIGMYDERIQTGEDWEFYLRLAEKYKFHSIKDNLVYVREHYGSRLGGRLRDYINTDIIIYRRFCNKSKLINQILVRKIASKLVRINKSKIARTLLKSTFNSFSRELFTNFVLYLLSYLRPSFYLIIHANIIRVYKKIVR